MISLVSCCKCLSRREWKRQMESSKTTSVVFNRLSRNGKMGYYNTNLNLGVGVNTSFLNHHHHHNNNNNTNNAKTNHLVQLNNKRRSYS